MTATLKVGEACPEPGCDRALAWRVGGRVACPQHGEPRPKPATRPCPRTCGREIALAATSCACGWQLGGGVMAATSLFSPPTEERARHLEPTLATERAELEREHTALGQDLSAVQTRAQAILALAERIGGLESALRGRDAASARAGLLAPLRETLRNACSKLLGLVG
jgi:hypothetical protein